MEKYYAPTYDSAAGDLAEDNGRKVLIPKGMTLEEAKKPKVIYARPMPRKVRKYVTK